MLSSHNRFDLALAFLSPTPSLLGTYLVGLLASALAGNLLYGLLTSPETLAVQRILVTLAVIAALIGLGAVLWRRHRRFVFRWQEGNRLGQYAGVVAVLSTPALVETLLRHHGPALRHLWIITNFGHQPYEHYVKETLPKLIEELTHDRVSLHPIHFSDSRASNAQETFRAVQQAYQEATGPEIGLRSEDVVTDITGGTKEMTAGVVLACAARGWPMSYIRSDYDWDDASKRNILVQGTAEVLEFDVSFLPGSPPTSGAGS